MKNKISFITTFIDSFVSAKDTFDTLIFTIGRVTPGFAGILQEVNAEKKKTKKTNNCTMNYLSNS